MVTAVCVHARHQQQQQAQLVGLHTLRRLVRFCMCVCVCARTLLTLLVAVAVAWWCVSLMLLLLLVGWLVVAHRWSL